MHLDAVNLMRFFVCQTLCPCPDQLNGTYTVTAIPDKTDLFRKGPADALAFMAPVYFQFFKVLKWMST